MSDPTVPVDPMVPVDPTLPVDPTVPAPFKIKDLHPDVLVAMVTARIGLTEISATPRTNPQVTAIVGSTARFIPVLDALASLGVTEQDGQIVAIAMQIDPDVTILTIAENAKTDHLNLQSHIENLFKKMKEISQKPNEKAALERQLYIMAYIYSSRKQCNRFKKWMPKLEAVLQNVTAHGMENLKYVLSALMTSLEVLLPLKSALDHNSQQRDVNQHRNVEQVVESHVWDKVLKLMTGGTLVLDNLLSDETRVNQWAVDLMKGTTYPHLTSLSPLPSPLMVEVGVVMIFYLTSLSSLLSPSVSG